MSQAGWLDAHVGDTRTPTHTLHEPSTHYVPAPAAPSQAPTVAMSAFLPTQSRRPPELDGEGLAMTLSGSLHQPDVLGCLLACCDLVGGVSQLLQQVYTCCAITRLSTR